MILGSAIAFSFGGVLTKLVDADAWTTIFWRGFFSAPCIIAYDFWSRKQGPIDSLKGLGWRGWLLAGVASATSAALIAAFKFTYIANVVIIYATGPFVAAALAWFALRERLNRITVLSSIGAFFGVIVMNMGTVRFDYLAGDLLAVLMTVLMATYLVLVRRFSETPAVTAMAVSSLQLFVVGFFLGDPLSVSMVDLVYLVVFGLISALGIILITEGTRLVAAAEVSLLATIDIPIAILLGWVVLAETPPAATIAGGIIVLAAVIAHTSCNFAKDQLGGD